MVVINPFSISNSSFKTYVTGAKQLVVHDAADIILSSFFILVSLTPNTIVLSAPLQGADTITFLLHYLNELAIYL